jgi:uncharacterized protein YlzI (FlbEa/FlbD family)
MIKLNLTSTYSNGRPVPRGEEMILVNPMNILLIEPRMLTESEEDGACVYFSDNGHVAITRRMGNNDKPIYEPTKVESYNKVDETVIEVLNKITSYDIDLGNAFIEVTPKEKFMNGYNIYGNGCKSYINSDFINKMESRGKETLILLNGGGYYKVAESIKDFEKMFV